ncbi:MAG TPA: hypothetical protein H9829_03870 [Candidatus Tetragenococcus pullicola]|nr:hypothetical protein [Candidatus Tetragenococcus pullicola]
MKFFTKLNPKERLRRFYLFGTPIGILAVIVGFWKLDIQFAFILLLLVASGWYTGVRYWKLKIRVIEIEKQRE